MIAAKGGILVVRFDERGRDDRGVVEVLGNSLSSRRVDLVEAVVERARRRRMFS